MAAAELETPPTVEAADGAYWGVEVLIQPSKGGRVARFANHIAAELWGCRGYRSSEARVDQVDGVGDKLHTKTMAAKRTASKKEKQLWQSRRCFPGCVLEVV